MAVERLHNRRGRRHGRFGEQPTRCQIQSAQGTLPAVVVRAVSIDPAEQSNPAGTDPQLTLKLTLLAFSDQAWLSEIRLSHGTVVAPGETLSDSLPRPDGPRATRPARQPGRGDRGLGPVQPVVFGHLGRGFSWGFYTRNSENIN
jgi:hypothetical protein